MAGRTSDTVLLLDIGTFQTRIAVARVTPPDIFDILAMEESPSLGVSKGCVEDVSSAVRVVKSLVDNVREQSGGGPLCPCIGFAGAGTRSVNYCSRMQWKAPLRVTSRHISELEAGARRNGVPEGFVSLHVYPVQFRVDGKTTARPEGYTGTEIEADMRLVIAPEKSIQALQDTARLSQVKECNIVFTPLAQACYLFNSSKIELGCVLIDLGAETTTVAAFKYGVLQDAVVLPVGMKHVVSDLAVGLHTTMTEAEKLFLSFAPAGNTPETKGQVHEDRQSSIINARMQEIFELVNHSINFMNLNYIPGGIKLTGGGSSLPGIEQLLVNGLQVNEAPEITRAAEESKLHTSLAGMANYYLKYLAPFRCNPGRNTRTIADRIHGLFAAGKYFSRRGSGRV